MVNLKYELCEVYFRTVSEAPHLLKKNTKGVPYRTVDNVLKALH